MSTIPARVINLLLNETHAAQYLDKEIAPLVDKIAIEDLDTLASNIPVLREHIISTRQAQQEATREKLEAFLKENASLGIGSVEELVQRLTGSIEATTVTTASKPAKDNNTKFTVTLFNPETQKHESFPVVNKVLSKKVKEHPAYVSLVEKDKSMLDVDNFLRAFSPEYSERYPINAKYKKIEFHINDQGKLNKQSQEFFDDYLKSSPENQSVDAFRQMVKHAYKKVN